MPNFGVLGAPLFRPEQDLAAEAADLYATNVPPGSIVVGTHIRCVGRIYCHHASANWCRNRALTTPERGAVCADVNEMLAQHGAGCLGCC